MFLSISSFETRWFAKTGSGQTFNEEEEVEEKTSSLMFSSHQPWEGAAVHAPPAARLIAARRSGSFRGNTSCEFLSVTSPSASSDVSEVALMGRMSAQPVGGVSKEDASAVGLFVRARNSYPFYFPSFRYVCPEPTLANDGVYHRKRRTPFFAHFNTCSLRMCSAIGC